MYIIIVTHTIIITIELLYFNCVSLLNLCMHYLKIIILTIIVPVIINLGLRYIIYFQLSKVLNLIHHAQLLDLGFMF